MNRINIKHVRRLTAVGATAGLVTLGITGVSTAAGPLPAGYSVTAQVTTNGGTASSQNGGWIISGAQSNYTVTFRNESPTTDVDLLNQATVTLPSAFSLASGSATVSGATSNGWTASTSGNTVTIAQGTGQPLLPATSISVNFTATNPSTTAVTYTFATTAAGTIGSTTGQSSYTNVGADPQFTTFGDATACAPGATCTIGPDGDNTNTQIQVTDTNTSGQEDAVGTIVPAPFTPACAGSNNPARPVEYDTVQSGNVITVNLFIPDKVADNGPNSASKYTICWDQTKQFQVKGGGQATSDGRGGFQGKLPNCTDTTPVINTPPCLTSIASWTDTLHNDPGGFQFTINGTAGDPISLPAGL